MPRKLGKSEPITLRDALPTQQGLHEDIAVRKRRHVRFANGPRVTAAPRRIRLRHQPLPFGSQMILGFPTGDVPGDRSAGEPLLPKDVLEVQVIVPANVEGSPRCLVTNAPFGCFQLSGFMSSFEVKPAPESRSMAARIDGVSDAITSDAIDP